MATYDGWIFDVRVQINEDLGIAGGYPSNIDAARSYAQAMSAMKIPAGARADFEAEFEADMQAGRLEPLEGSPGVIRTGFRWDGEGPGRHPLIGAYQIKAMLQDSARALYDKDSKPSIYQIARQITYGCEVRPNMIDIVGGEKGPNAHISQVISHPRNPSIKVPMERERDTWLGGTLTLSVFVLRSAKQLQESLPQLLRVGGQMVGLGTDRGYGYGRFTTTELSEPQEETIEVLTAREARRGVGYVRADRRKSSA